MENPTIDCNMDRDFDGIVKTRPSSVVNLRGINHSVNSEGPCEHFFICCKKRRIPSCLGTHTSHCKHCGMNYIEYLTNIVSEYYKNPTSPKLSEREKDLKFHVHVWDPVLNEKGKPIVKEKSILYKCVSNKTDWSQSTETNQIRVRCNEKGLGE